MGPAKGGETARLKVFLAAVLLWLGEVFVGTTPLMLDNIIHRFMEQPAHPASCRLGALVEFEDCHWVTNGSDVGICILAIVLPALALVPLFQPDSSPPAERWHWPRMITIFGLVCIMVIAAILYAVIVAGVNHKTHEVVRWIFYGSLLGSFLMAMDRAARQRPGKAIAAQG